MPARKKTNKSSSTNSNSDKKNKSTNTKPKTSTRSKKTSTKKNTAKKSNSSNSSKKKKIKVEVSNTNKKKDEETKASSDFDNIQKKQDLKTDLGFDDMINRTQIDSQKKFYQELNKEIEQQHLEGDYEKETEKKVEPEVRPIKKSVGLYRKRALFFISLTVILLVAIFYFSFSKLTITINPSEEVVNNNVLMEVTNTDNNNSISTNISLGGSVMAIESEAEKIYQSSGKEIIGEEVVGTVKLINNYSKNQPLVATTRLLSPDDKLFRIKETVNVPANSSIEVEVYADEVTKSMAIAPTTFTIPGLWAGLQDDIYGKSEEAFTYRTKTKDYITVSDIENAKEDLKNTMIEKVKKEANRMFDNRYYILYDIDNTYTSFTTKAVAGDEISEFNLSGKTEVVVVAFLKNEAKQFAQEKLALLVPGNKKLKEFDKSNLSYTLDNYNLKDGTATVKINFSGLMTIDDNTNIINRSQLINLNREQIRKYLDTFPEIKNYTLDFQPAFVNTAPSLVDRIEIKVVQ
jgi:hypothetical protein